MAYNPITAIKQNSYHSQDILAAAGTTVLLHLASKARFFNTLTWGQAANAAANGTSLVVAGKSAYAWKNAKGGDEAKSARNAFVASLLVGALSTTAGITNISETKFSGLPQFKEMKDMKIFGIATVAGGITSAVMTEGGVRGVKYVHSTYTAWAQDRAEKKDEKTFNDAVALFDGKDFSDGKDGAIEVAALNGAKLLEWRAACELLSKGKNQMGSGWTPTEDKSSLASEDLKKAMNARAAKIKESEPTFQWIDLT